MFDKRRLRYVVQNGMIQSLKKALDGGDLVASHAQDSRIFKEAKTIEVASLLVQHGVNIQTSYSVRDSDPLYDTVRSNRLDLTLYLLELDSLDFFTSWGSLFVVAKNPDIMRVLLEGGIVDICDSQQTGGERMWQQVDAVGADRSMKLLVAWGGDFYRPDKSIDDGWLAACVLGDVTAIQSFLDKGSHHVNDTDLDGNSGTLLAAMCGQEEVLALLLKHTPDLEQPDQSGNTALHWASSLNHVKCAEMLLDAGAKLETACQFGSTAMSVASLHAATDTARLLIARQANLTTTMHNGWTCFHLACGLLSDNGADILRMFLDSGVITDIDHTSDGGRSSGLRIAVGNNRLNIARFLIKHGANVNLSAHLQFPLLCIAANAGFTEMVQLLLENGADINTVTHRQTTALHIATDQAHYHVVKVLLAAGADTTIRDGNNLTARALATQQGWPELVALFDTY